MLFSSPEFLLGFLPVTLIGFSLLSRLPRTVYVRFWLLFASLVFYGWYNPKNVGLLLLSIMINFVIGKMIAQSRKKSWLTLGVVINLAILFYFKYVNFFLGNVNMLFDTQFMLAKIALPLGLSFYTFQQISFLVDSYHGKIDRYWFPDYCLFVSFFPDVTSGPIARHGELMPQLEDPATKGLNYDNISKGFFVFNMGLAKKIIIADTLAIVANNGYANTGMLSTLQGWVTSIAYSVQLYFDFSGYSDMALGIALLFNIKIPINFDSPYRSKDLQEFWRRWHMTLSRFLRDYLYIPLGGSRQGDLKTSRNLLITFILGGIWHGAGWTFIAWGFLHGSGLVIHRKFSKLKVSLPNWLAIIITLLFVNIAWVFFRAASWQDAMNVLGAMAGRQAGTPEFSLVTDFYSAPIWIISAILLFSKNTNELREEFRPDNRFLWKTVALVLINIIFLNSISNQGFLYSDF